MNENIKYLNNLMDLNFGRKNENKIGNYIEDTGCKAIFNNAKYLPNLETLNLSSNNKWSENRLWNKIEIK